MKKSILLILSLLIIEKIQQTNVTVSQNQEPFSTFDNALKRTLQEKESTLVQREMVKRLKKQILIWTSIILCFALYFTVMAIVYMPNPKSSILYAKYDTSRGGNEF